jgi:hypothetical protein
MTTPLAFKIVSLSTPSAFQSNEKVNKIYNSIPCTRVLTLPLVSTTVANHQLDLTGVCTVRLPSGSPPGDLASQLQYAITTVTGLVPGQIVTFFNDNLNFDYSISGVAGTSPTAIIYTGGINLAAATRFIAFTPSAGLLTTPAVGWYSGSTTGMYFNGGSLGPGS